MADARVIQRGRTITVCEVVVEGTNGKRIAFIHGDETNGWINKKIVLAPEMVDYRGAPVMAIRVKPAAVSEPPIKPAPAQGMNDDVSF